MGTKKIAHISEEVVFGRVRDLGCGKHETEPAETHCDPHTSLLYSVKVIIHPHHFLTTQNFLALSLAFSTSLSSFL